MSLGVTGMSLILGAWLYVDTYFAHAADLERVAVTLEQSMIQLRIDILEGRIDREHEKDNSNVRLIEKWNNEIRRLESRQKILTRIEMGNEL